MNTTPTEAEFKAAIDTMQYDVQFKYLIARITNDSLRTELLSAYLDACQIEEDNRRNARKAAVIINMFGVQS